MKNICLCADDYAISPAVSTGICELIEANRLAAVSVITASDYWPETFQALFPFRDKLDIGLHITLTNLKPLEAMPKFAPRGKMPGIGKVVQMAYCRALPYQEIQLEIARQLQRFYLYFGQWPTHLDGHHHVHILPGIREIMINLFYRQLDLEKCYIRNCVDNISAILQRKVACTKAVGIAALSRELKAQLKKNAVSTNNGFAGIYNFSEQQDYGKIFQQFLVASKEQMIIMCHPGYVDKALQLQDPVVLSREVELKFLLSKKFKEFMGSNDVKLQPLYHNLMRL